MRKFLLQYFENYLNDFEMCRKLLGNMLIVNRGNVYRENRIENYRKKVFIVNFCMLIWKVENVMKFDRKN